MRQTNISKFFQGKSAPVAPRAVESSSSQDVKVVNIAEPSHAEDLIAPNLTKRQAEGDGSRSLKFRRIVLGTGKEVQSDLPWELEEGDIEPQTANDPVEKSTATPSYTPLEKQVVELKRRYQDCLLMVECGYRMRFFGEDAEKAASILGIYAHMDHNFMVGSVPTFRAAFHCSRLLSAGVKVAVVRQTETAAIRKGSRNVSQTFERAVAGVFTSGTIIDDDDPAFAGLVQTTRSSSSEAMDDDSGDDDVADTTAGSNDEEAETDAWIGSYFESVHPTTKEPVGSLAAVCVRAHSVWIRSFHLDAAQQSLSDNLAMLKPAEIVFPETISAENRAVILRYVQSQHPSVSMSTADSAATSSSAPQKIMQGWKCLPPPSYRSAASAIAAAGSGVGWSASLSTAAQQAVAGLHSYLRDFGLTDVLSKAQVNVHEETSSSTSTALSSAVSSGPVVRSFALDAVTVRDLELLDGLGNANDQLRGWSKLRRYQLGSATGSGLAAYETGGLFHHLNHCQSVYGRRTLRQWLLNPLILRDDILERQQAIGWFINSNNRSGNSNSSSAATVRNACMETLRKLPDIEKMLTSLQFNRISPQRLRTMLLLVQRLDHLRFDRDLLSVMPALLRRWIESVDLNSVIRKCRAYADEIITSEDASSSGEEGEESLSGFFRVSREQQYPRLVQLRSEKQEVLQQLDRELQDIRTLLKRPQLQFTTLRTGAVSQVEHLIELPLAEEKHAPATWTRMSSTKQVVRFHAPAVLKVQDVLYRIRDECKIAAQEAWRAFVSEVSKAVHDDLRQCVVMLGVVDTILSLATVASAPGYVCPQYPAADDDSNDDVGVRVVQARHPVLERIFSLSPGAPTYLPNDIHLLGRDGRLCQVITGPNMGGKSSYCRMVALVSLLGQMGAYVPAQSAQLVVFDQIYTRMGSEDDLQSGRSTFLCELVRMNRILQHATRRSLVLIDELGRGTATHDGCAIAQATLEYLTQHIGCATLFITHFPQLSALIDSPTPSSSSTSPASISSSASNMSVYCENAHMSFLTRTTAAGDEEVTFLYKLVSGASQGSYGINVARLAGIKKAVLDRACVKAQHMLQYTHTSTSTQHPIHADGDSG